MKVPQTRSVLVLLGLAFHICSCGSFIAPRFVTSPHGHINIDAFYPRHWVRKPTRQPCPVRLTAPLSLSDAAEIPPPGSAVTPTDTPTPPQRKQRSITRFFNWVTRRDPTQEDNLVAEVAIIGAGVSGLVCARQLCRAGVSVILLESSNGVGGRVRTDKVDGFLLDRGFQVFIEAYPEVKEQLDYEKLELQPFLPGALVFCDGNFHRVSDPIRRPEDLCDSLFSPIGGLVDKLRVGLYRVMAPYRSLDYIFSDTEMDTLTFLQRRLGLSDNMIDRFFTPFYRGIFLAPLEEQSSKLFAFIFKMLADGGTSLPKKGMGEIAQQLANDLPTGVVRLNSTVQSLDPRDDRGNSVGGSVRLTLKGGVRVDCAAAVIATDGPSCTALLEKAGVPLDGMRPTAPKGRSSTCLYFALNSPPPITDSILVLNGEPTSELRPVNNVAFLDQCASTYAPPGQSLASVTVVGTPPAGEAELVALVRGHLGEWFGPEEVASWKHLKTYRVPFAQPAQRPLSIAGVTGFDRVVSLGSGIYCCGDHRGTPTLNGAMETGVRAANAVLDNLRPYFLAQV